MESIDNLRDYVLTAPSICSTTRAILVGYIDKVEHEVGDMRGFCERLDDAATKREDVTLWGVDYTALPVDADGVPIHVGDVMDSKVDYLFDGKPFTVRGLVLCEDRWEAADGRFGNRYDTDSLRHHHTPTVEDVLREFAQGLGVPVADSYVAATAAKLRLTEGEDE